VVAGITVVTTIDNKVYNLKSGVADMIVSLIKMAEANQASEDKSLRVRSGKIAAINDARISKHIPYKNCPAWLVVDDAISKTNKAARTYRVLDGPVEIIRTMYDMALFHGGGYITTWLTQQGKLAFGKSKRWNPHYVFRILRSKAVIGHLETKNGLIEDILPPIIDEDQWLSVQAEMDRRRDDAGGGPKVASFVNLYRSIGRCAECGGTMRTNTYPGKTYRYLECVNHVRKIRHCDNRSRYRVDILDKAVLDNFGLLTIPSRGRADAPFGDIAGLEATLATLRDQEKRLASRIARAESDDVADVLMPELKALRTEVTTVLSQLVVARKAVVVAHAPPIHISDLSDRVKIHAALRQQDIKVYFGERNEVMVVARGMLLSMVVRRKAEPPALMIGSRLGKVIMIQYGKLGGITNAPAGFPHLDPKLANDILAYLRRSATQSSNPP
jgi:hypothetical protein